MLQPAGSRNRRSADSGQEAVAGVVADSAAVSGRESAAVLFAGRFADSVEVLR